MCIRDRATFVAEKNQQVAFRVVADATKPEIKAAVELLFKVQVESVQVLNRKGKVKRFGRFVGRRRNERKAYVSVSYTHLDVYKRQQHVVTANTRGQRHRAADNGARALGGVDDFSGRLIDQLVIESLQADTDLLVFHGVS